MPTNDDDLKRLTDEPGFGPEGSVEYTPGKKLDFTDGEGSTLQGTPVVAPEELLEPGPTGYLKDLFSRLGSKMNQNLANADQLQRDNSNIMMDRMAMANPNKVGPRLPPVSFTGDGMLPQEKAYGEAMANGMAGSVAPIGNVAQALAPEAKAAISKAAPWMQNISKEAVENAIPVGEGLINKAGDSIAKQAAIAQQKFRNLQRMLRR